MFNLVNYFLQVFLQKKKSVSHTHTHVCTHNLEKGKELVVIELIWFLFGHFTCIISNTQGNPAYIIIILKKEDKAQRSSVTSRWSHSSWVREIGIECPVWSIQPQDPGFCNHLTFLHHLSGLRLWSALHLMWHHMWSLHVAAKPSVLPIKWPHTYIF